MSGSHSTAATIGGSHRGWERNDAFPVMFAYAGLRRAVDRVPRPDVVGELVPIGVGVRHGRRWWPNAVVHDIYIHGRLRWFGDGTTSPALDRLAEAH